MERNGGGEGRADCQMIENEHFDGRQDALYLVITNAF